MTHPDRLFYTRSERASRAIPLLLRSPQTRTNHLQTGKDYGTIKQN